MENQYELLGANESLELGGIKRCYLKKVREFSPEDSPEEFVKIRKAYEDIVQYRKDRNRENDLLIIEVYFEIMKISILKDDVKNFKECCSNLNSEMNIRNFKLISDQIIEMIGLSKKIGKIFFALELCNAFLASYERLNLVMLKESYILLSKSLKREIERDGY